MGESVVTIGDREVAIVIVWHLPKTKGVNVYDLLSFGGV